MTKKQTYNQRMLQQIPDGCHRRQCRSVAIARITGYISVLSRGGPAGISRAHRAVDESVAVQLLLELAPLLGFQRQGCGRTCQ